MSSRRHGGPKRRRPGQAAESQSQTELGRRTSSVDVGRVLPVHIAADPFAPDEDFRRRRESDGRSIPPAEDLDISFFKSAPLYGEPELPPAEHKRHRAVFSAAAMRRRAELTKYVTGAVGFSVALCFAALVKTAVVRAEANDEGRDRAAGVEARNQSLRLEPSAPAERPISVAAPAEPAPTVAVPVERAPTVAAPAERAPTVAAPAERAPTVAAPAERAPTVAEAMEPPRGVASSKEPLAAVAAIAPARTALPDLLGSTPAMPGAGLARAAVSATLLGSAVASKESSRRALERGQMLTSIRDGERSVALDPADGEAWLILGAAYQEHGQMSEALRCYRACTERGKRGPVGECRAMLR